MSALDGGDWPWLTWISTTDNLLALTQESKVLKGKGRRQVSVLTRTGPNRVIHKRPCAKSAVFQVRYC